jgi:hypothetical protein
MHPTITNKNKKKRKKKKRGERLILKETVAIKEFKQLSSIL